MIEKNISKEKLYDILYFIEIMVKCHINIRFYQLQPSQFTKQHMFTLY